jgi:hypothetical protein
MATFVEFLSVLNSAKQQTIFWHNQTESYSEHRTLNGFYDRILDLLDGLVESTAGIYGRPKGYEAHDFVDWTSTDETIKYFQNLYKYVETERTSLYSETWFQNQIDEISAQIAQTIYLLTLKK